MRGGKYSLFRSSLSVISLQPIGAIGNAEENLPNKEGLKADRSRAVTPSEPGDVFARLQKSPSEPATNIYRVLMKHATRHRHGPGEGASQLAKVDYASKPTGEGHNASKSPWNHLVHDLQETQGEM